jgi:hypothetical protein
MDTDSDNSDTENIPPSHLPSNYHSCSDGSVYNLHKNQDSSGAACLYSPPFTWIKVDLTPNSDTTIKVVLNLYKKTHTYNSRKHIPADTPWHSPTALLDHNPEPTSSSRAEGIGLAMSINNYFTSLPTHMSTSHSHDPTSPPLTNNIHVLDSENVLNTACTYTKKVFHY